MKSIITRLYTVIISTNRIDGNFKERRWYLNKKGLFAVLLHINLIVAFTINNTNIYNNNRYNTQYTYHLLMLVSIELLNRYIVSYSILWITVLLVARNLRRSFPFSVFFSVFNSTLLEFIWTSELGTHQTFSKPIYSNSYCIYIYVLVCVVTSNSIRVSSNANQPSFFFP